MSQHCDIYKLASRRTLPPSLCPSTIYKVKIANQGKNSEKRSHFQTKESNENIIGKVHKSHIISVTIDTIRGQTSNKYKVRKAI